MKTPDGISPHPPPAECSGRADCHRGSSKLQRRASRSRRAGAWITSCFGPQTWDAPTEVLEWLNSGTLLASARLTELDEAEATKMRDEILTTYCTSLVSSHPTYVAEYSDAVTDPVSRDYLKRMAEMMERTERRRLQDLRREARRSFARRCRSRPTRDRASGGRQWNRRRGQRFAAQ